MTNAQKKVLDRIKKDIPRFDFYNQPELYEIKRWEVKESTYGFISVIFVTGLKGDEGTAAKVFCRKSRQLCIGPRGSVTTCKYDKKLKRVVEIRGLFRCMSEGWV